MGIKLDTLKSGRGRHPGTSLAEINVIPLVDIMLVMLIIFMVTAPMMQTGIGVDLPRAETESAPAEDGLTLTVTKDMHIYVGDSIININLLEGRLLEHFYGQEKKVVYIKGDEGLPYGFIVNILDIAKKAGVEVIGLVTDPPEEKKPRR